MDFNIKFKCMFFSDVKSRDMSWWLETDCSGLGLGLDSSDLGVHVHVDTWFWVESSRVQISRAEETSSMVLKSEAKRCY